MKTLKTLLLGCIAVFFVTACQNDEIDSQEPPQLVLGENETLVNFELDASALPQEGIIRAYTPAYSKDNFQIYAFKKVDNDFKFEKEIAIAGLTYNATSKKLTGEDIVEIGSYKFLPVYGINQSTIKKVDWDKETSIEKAVMELTGQLDREIFLPYNKDASNKPLYNDVLKTYEFKISGESTANEVVKETLYRALSRVDILFVSAKKVKQADGSTVTEDQPYTGKKSDIIGTDIESLKIEFTDVNKGITYIGDPVTDLKPANNNFAIELKDLKRAAGGKITIGTGTDPKTSAMEAATYAKWDNIAATDIIGKGAHVFGTYLFPNKNATATTGVKLTIKGVGINTPRVIDLGATKIALEQNKVTLIKIRSIQDGTEPPTIFDTKVTFEVEVITIWNNGSNLATGEIS